MFNVQIPATQLSSPSNQCLIFNRCFLLIFKKLQKFDWLRACQKKTKIWTIFSELLEKLPKVVDCSFINVFLYNSFSIISVVTSRTITTFKILEDISNRSHTRANPFWIDWNSFQKLAEKINRVNSQLTSDQRLKKL